MSSLTATARKIGDAPGLRSPYLLLRLLNSSVKDSAMRSAITSGKFNRGHCSICDRSTFFIEQGPWLRDEYFCVDCYSIPRQRAIIHVLETRIPGWRDLVIHETAAGGQSSDKIEAEASNYTTSHFMPDVELGKTRDGVRCENLEALTFNDNSFDLFVTQDVFEHVLDPAQAFAEVARVLKPGGVHLFTIPLYSHDTSFVRAKWGEGGEIVNLVEPDYHGDPEQGQGWLVATEWGKDFTKFIEDASGLKTEVVRVEDKKLGLAGEFLEVFVSRKAK
jgi:SAM-dependent methyltransferase